MSKRENLQFEKKEKKKKFSSTNTLLFAFHVVMLAFRFTFLLCERVPAFGDYVNRLLHCYSMSLCVVQQLFVVHIQKSIPYDISVIFFPFIRFCVVTKNVLLYFILLLLFLPSSIATGNLWYCICAAMSR